MTTGWRETGGPRSRILLAVGLAAAVFWALTQQLDLGLQWNAAAAVLEELAGDTGLRNRLGAAARERALRNYSWQAHCRALDERISRLGPPR